MTEVEEPLVREKRTSEQQEADDLDLELELSSDAEAQSGANGSALASAKLSSKKKEALSQVPCKFFRSNGCSAGNSCPFAHIMPGEGQGKAVCQWFLKGSCRFGHKCALAHILPGQPMSMDRKNKRAAQHQQTNQNSGAGGQGQQRLQPDQRQPSNRQSFQSTKSNRGMEGGNTFNSDGHEEESAVSQTFVLGNAHQQREAADLLFGVPDDLQGSSGSQAQQIGVPPNRASMAPYRSDWKTRLSQQGEEMDSHASRSHDNGAVGSPMSTQAFGTSPFSHPGSNSVFFSNASTSANRLAGDSNQLGSRSLAVAGGRDSQWTTGAKADEGEANGGADINEEDFLPSSLSDLLTPAELQRRRRSGLSGTPTFFATPMPQSMPAQTSNSSSLWGSRQPWSRSEVREGEEDSLSNARQQLARDRAAAAAATTASTASTAFLHPTASNLGMSNTSAGFLTSRMQRGLSSSGHLDGFGTSVDASKGPMDAYSPGAQAALSHAPGQSLPQGLAAGLSRLHLRTDSNGSENVRSTRLQSDSRTTSSSSNWNQSNGGVIGVPSRAGGGHAEELGPTAPSSIFAQRAPIHLAMARSLGGGSVSNSLDGLQHQPGNQGNNLSSSINGSAHTFTPYARSPANRAEGGIAIPAASAGTTDALATSAGGSGSLGNTNISSSNNHHHRTQPSHPGVHRVRTAATGFASPLSLATTGEEVEEPMFELE